MTDNSTVSASEKKTSDCPKSQPPCIRLACLKFELTNQDSAGEKNFLVLLIFTYKVKKSLAPVHICDKFNEQFKNYNLHSSDFPVPRFNTLKYG